ncbi:MAG TPA: glycosyltransferase family 4 protein [bacterium]|nr:glycosyltransferase family 4 protein [bacterium]
MKLVYLTNARIPTEKAHGYQIIKTCEALADLGMDVELVAPTRKNFITESIFSFYQVKDNFRITYLKSFDFFAWHKILGHLSFFLNSLTFLLKLRQIKIAKDSLIYTRQAEIAWLMAKRGYQTFFEAHRWPLSKNFFFKSFLKNITGVIGNSQGTINEFTKRGWTNVLVAPNGVDLDEFNLKENKIELRQSLKLPLDKKIILYVGHLYYWKGIEVILALAEKFKSNSEIVFVIAGGTKTDLETYQKIITDKKITNLLLLGLQPHDRIPALLKCADLLLLPNTSVTEESKSQTSPIKMFEYMASGVPILASDLPSIKEVLNFHNAFLAPAGNVQAWQEQIIAILQNPALSVKIATEALNDVQQYSWHKRAEKIINFIK